MKRFKLVYFLVCILIVALTLTSCVVKRDKTYTRNEYAVKDMIGIYGIYSDGDEYLAMGYDRENSYILSGHLGKDDMESVKFEIPYGDDYRGSFQKVYVKNDEIYLINQVYRYRYSTDANAAPYSWNVLLFGYKEGIYIYCVDKEGNIKNANEITEYIDKTDNELLGIEQNVTPKNMFVDNDKNIFVVYEKKVVVFDKDMNYLNEYAEPNTSIIYSVLTDKGQIMLICSNTSSITVMISDSSGVFSEYPLNPYKDASVYPVGVFAYKKNDKLIYMDDEKGIYSLDMKTSEASLMFEWSDEKDRDILVPNPLVANENMLTLMDNGILFVNMDKDSFGRSEKVYIVTYTED